MYGIVSDDDRDFEATVRGLLALGRTELGMSYGTLSRIRGEEYVFEVVDAAADADGVTEGDAVPLSATNCEITASERETLVLGDVARDAPGETDRAGYAEWGIACYLGAPVTVEDEVYGTFCFYDTESRPGGFGEWAVTLVDLMSRWVSYELSSRRTTDRLRRQNAKLERFASVLSHDLRNPLSVLRGSLDAAVDGDEAAVGRCRRAVDRMDELVEDVLAMARAGETVESPRPVDLGALASDCWTVVDTAAASLDLADAPTVAADEPRLRRLVENLLRNAVEHGGRDVTVTVGGLDDGDGFFVADDGAGIGPDERDRVLEHGYSTAPEGTGLGLSIVAEIASGHGWRLAVTESAAGGARFEFRGAGWSGPDAADTGPGRA
jgi:anti-sigma regulatory factor (Ser/Thr protein kinase)